MSYFEEIFGYEELPKLPLVRVKAEPELPWDDFRWQSAPESATAPDVFAKIEANAFAEEILGPSPIPGKDASDSSELQHSPVAPAPPISTFTTPIATANLLELLNRLREIQERGLSRQHAITHLLKAEKTAWCGICNIAFVSKADLDQHFADSGASHTAGA